MKRITEGAATGALCQCGCGESIPDKLNSQGKRRRFVHGHNCKGSNAWNWKGGRTTHAGGYALIRMPDHPRAAKGSGYVLEHLVVAERAMGKPLPRTARVHHVNENRSDNRPGNLVVCEDHSYHLFLHRRMRARDATGNINHRRCWICKKWDDRKNLRDGGRCNYFHAECRRRYQREASRVGRSRES